MKLTVLGSGTLVPHAERGSPGFAVSGDGSPEVLLFDGGSGTLQRAVRAGIDWRAASRLFYTHYHPDHTLDLVSFLFAANYAPPEPRTSSLTVFGPAGLQNFYHRVQAAWPSVTPTNYELALRELNPGDNVEIEGNWCVSCAAMDHGESGGLGYRVEREGRALVLSGDTQYCPELVRLAADADLLVCECSADDAGRVDGHMTPSQVARVAAESGVKKILINHVYSPLAPEILAAECAKISGARVEHAVDLRSYEV
ncbi:MAG: MBL fold metallo-hydrolase [Candidatus Glassbacteria bacterium]|nr:MBL fold metallo-hydrolase [Candidatus Glassbacteria bacterium]